MIRSESDVWKLLKGKAGNDIMLQRFECSMPGGVPDVHYLTCNGVSGWIELKYIKELPKRESTPIRIPHFTQQQKLWIQTYGSLGGNAWVFVCLPSDWCFLFSWKVVHCLGEWDLHEMGMNAEMEGCGRNYSAFLQIVLEKKPTIDACDIQPKTFQI